MTKENIEFFEDEIIEYLMLLPIHDRYLHCDAFASLCQTIGEDNFKKISVFDCMKLWEKFRDKEWEDIAKWKDEDGKCICKICQEYKKNKREEDIKWLIDYPHTLPKKEYIKRCESFGLTPIER